jgi:hypothetical protein
MRRDVIAGSLILFALAAPSWAKPPTVHRFFPAGAPIGSETELEVAGDFDDWPVEGVSQPPGLELTAGEEKGNLTVNIPEDAEPGIYLVRLTSAAGVSAWKPFVVGRRPEVLEVEPNNSLATAQQLEGSSVVVNGKLAGGQDVDIFSVRLEAGETLVVSVLANEVLGSPMDSVVQVCDERGFVLEQNDDERGLDSQLVFTAPTEGDYYIRLFAFPAAPNSSIAFSASDDYVYRLTLTTGPFVDHSLPLAISRAETATEIELAGWNLQPEHSFLTVEPEESDGVTKLVTHEALSQSVRLPLVEHPQVVVESPGAEGEPLDVTIPVVVSGRIATPGERDIVRFSAEKDEKLVIRVESRSLGFALDPVARISSPDGNKLAEMDDASRNERDVLMTFTVPEDGLYDLSIRDLHGHGGLRYSYRATLERESPGFTLTTPNDALVVKQGESVALPLDIERQSGFAESIDVVVEELPEGITWEAAESSGEGEQGSRGGRGTGRGRGRRAASADSSGKINVTLTADVEPGHYRLRVRGAVSDDGPSARLRFQTAGIHYEEVWLTVTP